MGEKRRVIAYVDGFNLYHTIKSYRPNKVDLWSLFEGMNTPDEQLVAVKYFSAYAYWLPKKTASHKRYVKDLKARGVEVILGQFKEKRATKSHEEKETDINIALSLVLDGMDDRYDRAKLLTVDSDLVAAVREARRRRPDKSVLIVKPPGRENFGRELTQASGSGNGFTLTPSRVKRCMFDPR